MLATSAGRWAIAALVALAIVLLVAYARNDPGVGGRIPDPEDAVNVVVDDDDRAF